MVCCVVEYRWEFLVIPSARLLDKIKQHFNSSMAKFGVFVVVYILIVGVKSNRF